jgi:hypothetical protein
MTARKLLAHRAAAPASSPADLLERTRLDVLAYLLVLAEGIGAPAADVVRDYLLFTTVGAAIERDRSFFFALGDGIIIVNGVITRIGPFPGNAPPYMAYSLLPGYVGHAQSSCNATNLMFQVYECIPTREVRHFLIGSDGAADFIAAQDRKLPGREQLLGPVSRFWEGDFYGNPRKIERYLRLANEPAIAIDWEGHRRIIEAGLLPDDSTLVVGRRRPAVNGSASVFSPALVANHGPAAAYGGEQGKGPRQEALDG